MKFWPQLLIFYGLACFRLAMMLSTEKGPYFVFVKLRSWLKREAKESKPVRESKIHVGITCQLCTSVWVAFPVSAFAYYHKHLPGWFAAVGDVFLGAMSLSALAIIVNRLVPPK